MVCSGCESTCAVPAEEGGDTDDGASDGENTGGGASGAGVTRAARTRTGRSWHRPLVQTEPDEPGGQKGEDEETTVAD